MISLMQTCNFNIVTATNYLGPSIKVRIMFGSVHILCAFCSFRCTDVYVYD